MSTWPADVPHEFEADSLSLELGEQLVRSRTRRGRPQVRQLPDRREGGAISGIIQLSTDEWDDLMTFYEDTLDDGALSFDFPDPEDTSEDIVVAFAEPPSLQTIGGDRHFARVTLERQ